MYLKCHKRFKDGKAHRYWSIVESVRTRRGVIKRQLLYLGEINDAQRAQWCSALEVLDESNNTIKQMSLFPADRTPPPDKRTVDSAIPCIVRCAALRPDQHLLRE